MTGCIQSMIKKTESQPEKVGESSQDAQKHLDAKLDTYNQVCEPILPYVEEPPLGVPDVEMSVPEPSGASSTLPTESTMNFDDVTNNLYQ